MTLEQPGLICSVSSLEMKKSGSRLGQQSYRLRFAASGPPGRRTTLVAASRSEASPQSQSSRSRDKTKDRNLTMPSRPLCVRNSAHAQSARSQTPSHVSLARRQDKRASISSRIASSQTGQRPGAPRTSSLSRRSATRHGKSGSPASAQVGSPKTLG